MPRYNDLPELELYMDQVITLLTQYLKMMSNDKIITQSMINNYVKLGIMPAPEKKRYKRVHLAYLIIICFLKQTLNMDLIRKIIPNPLPEEDVKAIYESFQRNQKKAFKYVIDQVKMVALPILQTESEERMNDLVTQVAITSNICKVLTEEITK